ALLRDKRPDLVQVEEESTTPAAQQVVRAARYLGLPAILFTRQNVDVPLPWLARRRRRRMLRRIKGAIAGSGAAAALLRRVVPDLPGAAIPQPGIHVPTEPPHMHHEGVAIRCEGRLVAEARAYEVAVVGTSAGATPEVIGGAGVVVPPDDPLALSGALRRLASPDQRRPLAQAGRARAMQFFSDDAVAERTLAFWKELVG